MTVSFRSLSEALDVIDNQHIDMFDMASRKEYGVHFGAGPMMGTLSYCTEHERLEATLMFNDKPAGIVNVDSPEDVRAILVSIITFDVMLSNIARLMTDHSHLANTA